MRPFELARPDSLAGAMAAVQAPGAMYVAGGTTIVDLVRAGAERPSRLVDINRIPGLVGVARTEGGFRIGALARMADVAADETVAAAMPAVVQSLRLAASTQIRNMASIGGNLLQRTRCPYFRKPDHGCNKRTPGSGCAAAEGDDKAAAIFGASGACRAVYPGDLAIALIAFDAELEIASAEGEMRLMPLADLHRLPGEAPHLDTTLAAGDLITALRIPASASARRSVYCKVRDRASYEFALVSVAAGLDVDGSGLIRDARLAAGGVGTVPWRLTEAEQALIGTEHGTQAWARAADLAVRDAVPGRQNAYKVDLLKRTLVAVLRNL
ncbi:MAG: xanthine dehydrogenase family protein subunit M [Pseudomonadota bacterium]